MANPLTQIGVVTAMNLRSIPQRRWTSISTVIAVALVTGVLLSFLAMSNGFRSTVQGTGSLDVAMIMRKGGGGELNSVLSREQVLLMEEAKGIARGSDGKPLTSAEMYAVVDGIKISSGTKANLPLRGVGPKAIDVRRSVKIVAGRMFAPGAPELVVGRAVSKQFKGYELGKTVRLASQNWRARFDRPRRSGMQESPSESDPNKSSSASRS